MKIKLDVDSVEQVPEDLYEYLLDQFIAKALEQGYDVVNNRNLMLDNWSITCDVVDIS